jgi:uroporphyrinogen decarboxylase
MWKPDFELFLKALKGGKTPRPVFYDLHMDDHIAEPVAGKPADGTPLARFKRDALAFAALGYDYAPTMAPSFGFKTNAPHGKESATMNETKIIDSWEDFGKYEWLEPDERIPEYLEAAAKLLPEGAKLFVFGPCGVLENCTGILGFDNMMIKLYEDPDLVRAVVDGVGSRLLRYYELALQVKDVGVIMGNDDWGFKTQTMMSPRHMREYIFPWHKKAVAAAHAAGRVAVLHSCGEHRVIMDDIIDDMRYDGKHSYEDTIQPVEEAYDQYGQRICVMGGIDMDFCCRKTPEEVYARSHAMLLKSRENGRYMLGTGNSLARYLPLSQYHAMHQAAFDLANGW